MNSTFQSLNKEAQFTLEMLGAGATQIRNADYAQKGVYFQAFTNLSTGLERIGKLCLMLDYYIQTQGNFPDIEFMRKEIGHDIEKLYSKSQVIVTNRGFQFEFFDSLVDPIHTSILSVLSGFARGDRYSNIDLLVGETRSNDPVSRWFAEIDMPLFQRNVSENKKEQISSNAKIIAEMMGTFTLVRHTSETGGVITDLEEASFRTGFKEAVAPYRQQYVLQIIRYWVELIGQLQYSSLEMGTEDIPWFSEIFARFYNDDAFFRSRKTWDKN